MGRSPCCDKVGLKKGPWTPEEDQKLLAYIEDHGHGSWRGLPAKAGLERCGKSCRLRWTNYLRPDIKRGKFSLQEEQTIIQLHALLGNRWSAIATHLPKRTDNEIKNYWNTHLKKRLANMGIDPVTHKQINDTLLSTDVNSKNSANLSHMAQWESARLEAEARLVRESKLRSHLSVPTYNKSENHQPRKPVTESIIRDCGFGSENSIHMIELVSNGTASGCSSEAGYIKEEGEINNWIANSNLADNDSVYHDHFPIPLENQWTPDSLRLNIGNTIEEGFTSLLLSDPGDRSLSDSSKESDSSGCDYYEDNNNYWNSILNLVNSSPSDSPVF